MRNEVEIEGPKNKIILLGPEVHNKNCRPAEDKRSPRESESDDFKGETSGTSAIRRGDAILWVECVIPGVSSISCECVMYSVDAIPCHASVNSTDSVVDAILGDMGAIRSVDGLPHLGVTACGVNAFLCCIT